MLGLSNREWHRLYPIAILYFLIMAGLAFGRSANDAFFIDEAGAENMPIIYLINSVMMVLISVIYSIIEKHLNRYRLFLGLLIIFAGALTTLRLLIDRNYFWMPYGLFCYYESFILMIQMHFWTYANDIFDPREGKRIFPYIGGAGLFGIITGGLMTAPVVQLIGTVDLFYVWVGAILLAMFPLFRLHQTINRQGIILHDFDEADVDTGVIQSMRNTINIPLVRALALLTVPLWLTVHTVDYLFYLAVEDTFTHRDEMTAFLGLLNGSISLSGLLIQFLITRRLLNRFGVALTFLSYSVSMTLGAVALTARTLIPGPVKASILHPKAMMIATARFLDEAILHSVYDSATQLLYNAIPGELRGQARAFINGLIEPLSTALAGGILFTLYQLDTSQTHIGMGATVMGVIWFLLALRVRPFYLRALMDSIGSRDIDQRSHAMHQLSASDDEQTDELLVNSIRNQNTEIALLSLEYLKSAPTRLDLNRLNEILPEVKPEVQISILDILGDAAYRSALPTLLSILDASETVGAVRAACIRAIAAMQSLSQIKKFPRFFNDPDYAVRREAIIAVLKDKKRIATNSKAYQALMALCRSRSMDARVEAAATIRVLGHPRFTDALIKLSGSKDPGVRYESIRSLGYIQDRKAVAQLVRLLEEEQFRHRAVNSLVRQGNPTLHVLHEELLNGGHSHVARINIIQCLGEIGNPHSIEVLGSMLVEQDIEIEDAAIHALAEIKERILDSGHEDAGEILERYFTPDIMNRVHRAYGAIVQKISRDGIYIQSLERENAPQKTKLLIDTLIRASNHREHVALKFLEILDRPERIRAAAASLRSRDRRAIAEAIELIEGAGKEGSALAWVLELKYNEEQLLDETLPLSDIMIQLLIQKQNPWITACVLFTIGELKLHDNYEMVSNHMDDTNPLIKFNAAIALSKLGGKIRGKVNVREVNKMAGNMERILFLRSVPIFADIDGYDLQWINEITREKRYRRGQIVFRENDLGDALYIILKGQIRILKGESIVLQVMEDRDCFGEMSILDEEPRSATAEVARDSTLLAIKRDDFQRLMLARPQIAVSMFKSISRRLREATSRLSQLPG